MAAKTGTYTLIASNTLGSAAASVTFSSIPGTYTDLVIVANGLVTTAGDNIQMQFNSDTATNYSTTILEGNGTAASSTRLTTKSFISIDDYGFWDTVNRSVTIVNIMDYTNTTTYKTCLSRANNANNGLSACVGLWRSTSAITSVKLNPNIRTFDTGSTFKLYGIEAGNL